MQAISVLGSTSVLKFSSNSQPASIPNSQTWEWRCGGKKVADIMLTADFGIQWAWRKRNCGRWEYMWHQETETGYFILEFSAKNSLYWRKHIMQQTDDGTRRFHRGSIRGPIRSLEGREGCSTSRRIITVFEAREAETALRED